ncbi:THUMP-like domain-containing protein [Sphingobacterium sp. Mn56C]|uniref:THUMP-like domain-containing protein n=1 Tax=Sphingobacterium sp. Mn56C TaxID=3395261 RepID=UPI003BD7EAE0
MNKHILQPEVQQYIKEKRELNPSIIALGKSPFHLISSSELAGQVDGWQRAVKKLPTWAYSPNIYYPDKINLEQCSSEHTALVKQRLIQKGSTVVDVTGGFGVDSCYLAQEADMVIHCELNERLSEVVQHNAKQLGVNNLQCIATDGVAYVEAQRDAGLGYIYIDPSRRVNHAKVFLLEDCVPNIVALQDMFFQKAQVILCKLSPLMDISTALQKLKQVKTVYVISVDGDCKELLFVQDRNYNGQPNIVALRLFSDQIQELIFTAEQEKMTRIETVAPQKFLYDPDVAITKAGAFKTVAAAFHVGKLHSSTHLYTSTTLVENFPGRCFHIVGVFSLPQFKKTSNFPKANVAAKNFPLKVEEIRKKYKIKDGGNDFLYFTTDPAGNYIVIHCTKAL